MSGQARITSVDAVRHFQACLINYRDKTRSTVEEITGDMLRIRQWLQQEQRAHWEGQIRRRTKLLDEARQTLYNAELANLRSPTVEERMAVRKAKTALDEAQDKLNHVKKWHRDFEGRIEPEVRRLNGLHTFLAKDLREAIADLEAMTRALDDYCHTTPSASPAETVAPQPADESTTPSQP